MSCSRHFSSGIFLDSRSFSDAEGARKAARVRICVKIRDIAKRCCLDGCFKSEPNSFDFSTSRASRKYLIEHSYTVITFSLTEGWGLQRLINIFSLKKVEIHQHDPYIIQSPLRWGGIGPIRSAKYTEKSGLKALSICPNVADKVRNGRVQNNEC